MPTPNIYIYIYIYNILSLEVEISKMIFFKETNTFIQQQCMNLSKVTVNTCLMLQNIYILNKYCSFECYFYQRILKKKSWFPQKILFKYNIY